MANRHGTTVSSGGPGQGILTLLNRLLRDRRGNTLAMVAAFLFPLLGLIGGGVDMSRLYLTRTRMQQACDAGALAGRQAMGTAQWTTGTNSTESRALSMFGANFQQGDYGTGTLTRSYTATNGNVNGTATSTVPMAIVRVFGIMTRNVTVTCTAQMAIPNTDIMFVLDVTGSMAGTKLSGLKSAVKCFYEAIEKVNTTENCVDGGAGDPTATSYTGTAQIRIGFVPYAVNVNVGKVIPPEYIADSWTYQSRRWAAIKQTNSSSSVAVNSGTKTSLSGSGSRCPSNTYTDTSTQGAETQTVVSDGIVYTSVVVNTRNGRLYTSCTLGFLTYNYNYDNYSNYKTTTTYTYKITNTANGNGWIYEPVTFNVSGVKTVRSTRYASLPVGALGTSTNVTWDGCIEEARTVKNSDGDPSDEWGTIPADAYDMQINLVPDSSRPETMWGPLMRYADWGRYIDMFDCGGSNCPVNVTYPVHTVSDLSRNFGYSCPSAEAKKLAEWTTPATFVTYVNSLAASGNTYHDIGLIWGARFLSPTGMFRTDNTNLRNIQRHMIFMTDGDTNVIDDDYSAYGIHWWDRRQTTYMPNNTQLNNILNARMAALCDAIKNQNITLWVISYGTDVTGATADRLRNCASEDRDVHYMVATDTESLMTQFQQIASKISDLRLTN